MKLHLVVGLLLASLALAGCTGDDSDSNADDFRNEINNSQTQTSGTDGGGGSTSQDTQSETDTSTDGPAGEGTIDVDFSASALSGNVPLTVTFDLDAVFKDADGVAQDGVAAEWAIFSVDESLGLEMEGTDLPAQVNFTFEQEGSWVMAAGVKADGYQNRIVNVTIEVVAAGEEIPVGPETWYLHQVGDCAGGTTEEFMDKTNTEGDVNNCVQIGDAWLLGETGGASMSYPSQGATSNGYDAGTSVGGTIHFGRLVPGVTQMEIVLLSEGSEVGRFSSEPTPSVGAGILVYFNTMDFQFDTTSAIASGASLQLDIYVTGHTGFLVGHDGDTASNFTIG